MAGNQEQKYLPTHLLRISYWLLPAWTAGTWEIYFNVYSILHLSAARKKQGVASANTRALALDAHARWWELQLAI